MRVFQASFHSSPEYAYWYGWAQMTKDLGEIQGLRAEKAHEAGVLPQEPVDHHVFQSRDGAWHLWGCIRGTAVGRVLYHWESDSLEKEHWTQTGEVILKLL